jgi:hypothetical protein
MHPPSPAGVADLVGFFWFFTAESAHPPAVLREISWPNNWDIYPRPCLLCGEKKSNPSIQPFLHQLCHARTWLFWQAAIDLRQTSQYNIYDKCDKYYLIAER